MILVGLGVAARLGWGAWALIGVSVLSDAYGVLWFFGRLPVRPAP
jgi:O-antigen/teichoic acid export membrane protein